MPVRGKMVVTQAIQVFEIKKICNLIMIDKNTESIYCFGKKIMSKRYLSKKIK